MYVKLIYKRIYKYKIVYVYVCVVTVYINSIYNI